MANDYPRQWGQVMSGNVSKRYYADPYYQSQEYKQKLLDAHQIERNRRDFVDGASTEGALNYARFLSACENDASINSTSGFQPDGDDILFSRHPFLASGE